VALGTLARRRGNDQQALTHYNAALRYSRNSHPEALLGTALLVLDQENPGNGYITAAKYVKTLLEAEPAPSPRQLAQAHMVKALLVSRVAHDIPLFTKVEFQKELEAGTGIGPDPAKAKSDITSNENEAFTADRSNPELFIIRAKRLYYEERFDDAAAEVQKAIQMNGSDAHFHVELARVLLKKDGGEAMAEEALKKAIALVPNSPKLLALLGQAQYRGKKIDDAKATLEKATQDSKTHNPDARLLLGKILRDDKKDYEPTQAATAFDELGQAYELKKDNDKARVSYEKALNSDKDYSPEYCHYAKLLSKLGEAKDKLKAMATESLKQDPNGPCANDMRSLTAVAP
jgi:tetratricopeptide (TPR) repeat protein